MTIENNDKQMEEFIEPAGSREMPAENIQGETVEADAEMLAVAAQNAGVVENDTAADGQAENIDAEKESQVRTADKNADKAEEEIVIKSVVSDEGVEVTVESVVESVLFACDEPVTPNKLVNILGTGSVKQIRQCIMELNKKYEESNSAFRIEKIAGGYQMMTLDAYNHWLRKLIKVRSDNKLTQAALETLAIIAYKQPIIRADVEAIRGVSSGEMIRSLMYKGLVKIAGRAEVLGRPMLYGTTKKFLDVFGLNATKDLPKIEELKKSN